jgi:hypothetical protein
MAYKSQQANFSAEELMARTTRRQFLQKTATLTTGATVLANVTPRVAAAEPPKPLLPTIKLGRYDVTRLIIGGNPIYGHSHFNRILSQYMVAWHTPERVVELIRHAEAHGINTWQNSYAERTLSDLDKYREQGGRMNWLCLGKPDWDQRPELIEDAAKRKPIGIAPHGALGDRLHRQGKTDVLVTLLKRIRDTGALVGLSAHNPELIELAEEKGWPVDYYMCCLYYLTRPREQFQKLMGGEISLGEIYLESDPPRMFKAVRATKKPCLVYKILAAGRKVENANQVKQAFAHAFTNIKPTDAVIVGMYQQQSDQVAQNTALVREICVRPA